MPTDITRKYVPVAARAGCLIVDDSSVFRMEKEVPLVIPEINGSLLRDFQGRIISTPNRSTTPVALCLKPLNDKFGSSASSFPLTKPCRARGRPRTKSFRRRPYPS